MMKPRVLHGMRHLHPSYPVQEWARILLEDWKRYARIPSDPQRISAICNQAALIFFRLGRASHAERLCRQHIELCQHYFRTTGDPAALLYAFQPLVNLGRLFAASGDVTSAGVIHEALQRLLICDDDARLLRLQALDIRMSLSQSLLRDDTFRRFLWANTLVEGFKTYSLIYPDDTLERWEDLCRHAPEEFGTLVSEGFLLAHWLRGELDCALRIGEPATEDVRVQVIFLLHKIGLLRDMKLAAESESLARKLSAAIAMDIVATDHSAFDLVVIDDLVTCLTREQDDLRHALVCHGLRRSRHILDQRYWQHFAKLTLPTESAGGQADFGYRNFYGLATVDAELPSCLWDLNAAINNWQLAGTV